MENTGSILILLQAIFSFLVYVFGVKMQLWKHFWLQKYNVFGVSGCKFLMHNLPMKSLQTRLKIQTGMRMSAEIK